MNEVKDLVVSVRKSFGAGVTYFDSVRETIDEIEAAAAAEATCAIQEGWDIVREFRIDSVQTIVMSKEQADVRISGIIRIYKEGAL